MDEKTVLLQKHNMPPKLIVIFQREIIDFPLKGQQSFGRNTEQNRPDIGLDSRVLSRDHGTFVTQGGVVYYQDNNSTNGTILNDNYIKPNEPVQLNDGDVLHIHGRTDNNHLLDITICMTTSYRDNREWKKKKLSGDVREIAIGRDEKTKLTGKEVSRRHASFFLSEKGWAVIDHGSTNGVFINNIRLAQPTYLQPCDVVRIADYIFFYTNDELIYQSDVKEHSDVAENDESSDVLSVWIEERNVWNRARKKTLLKDINMDIPSGSMVLVLGGSGAGKTTFMNAVMGYEQAKGKISYGGVDIYEEYNRMKYEIGYVPQQDLLRMNDTVYETLMNACSMRLPSSLSREEMNGKVRHTLALLGLEGLEDELVVKLSGGQRKRLSIAVEYIGDPKLFFLDEPDSGLDGVMARFLMENLRKIADDGRIVIVISHGPDRAYDLWDKVIVLAKDSHDGSGRLVFYGAPDDALDFFDAHNLEQIVRRINRKDEGGDEMADFYIKKYEGHRHG